MANVPVPEKSDAAREGELRAAGKVIGDGELHGENDCCADSLLQLLAAHGFVPAALLGNAGKGMRKSLCVQCRQHLVEHADERLHPQILDASGARAHAYQAEHNRAHLQHDLHAEAIVRFFLAHANANNTEVTCPLSPRGVRIVVYTRYDSLLVDPEELSLVFGREHGATAQGLEDPVRLEMYNVSGNDHFGYHYKPVFDAAVLQVNEGVGKGLPVVAKALEANTNSTQVVLDHGSSGSSKGRSAVAAKTTKDCVSLRPEDGQATGSPEDTVVPPPPAPIAQRPRRRLGSKVPECMAQTKMLRHAQVWRQVLQVTRSP